ncbi:MAG TPA: Mut7-C RNAse domain-containing protein [Fervidobacterium sp.]|nr:hypothetical protein [Fervidobacterium sp.]HQE48379.1 Mut7-C RNAse domain-containing protein [Fervidobacterium sp.]
MSIGTVERMLICMNSNPKFVCDGTVVKLGKRLRILGYDVEITYKTDLPNVSEMIVATGRTLITKSITLHKQLGGIHVKSDRVMEQVEEIISKLGVPGSTRCSRCNSELVECDKDSVKDKVPIYVFQTNDKFKCCTKCGKVYWKGTHIK